MHANDRVHQALGPESLLLSTTEERDAGFLRVRLYDLGLAVDVSDAALLGGPTLGDLWDSWGRTEGTTIGFRCDRIATTPTPLHEPYATLKTKSRLSTQWCTGYLI